MSTDLSRRQLMTMLGLGAAGIALSPALNLFAREPSVATPTLTDPSLQGAGFFTFALGEATVSVISDGGFVMKPRQVISDATDSELKTACDDAHISLDGFPGQVNTLLIRRGNDLILIDTGAGTSFGPTAGFLLTNLAHAGVKPADITHVVLSHAHPDHAGGLLTPDGKPVFTRAKVILNRKEHDFWMGENPTMPDCKAPAELQQMMVTSARKNLGGVKDSIELVKLDDTIAGVVKFVEAYGHTPGHCALEIGTTDGPKITFLGDAIFVLPLQMRHPEWHAMFDGDPTMAAETRQKLFARQAKSKALTSSAHMPFPGVGYIDEDMSAFKWTPRPWTWGKE